MELRGHKFPEWSVTPSDRGFSIRGERTGGGGHKPSLPPVLTGATRRQRGTDQRERLRSSRPSGATDTVYRVRGPGGWDGQVGLQALQTHCAPKKPVAASELTSQEVLQCRFTGSARRRPGNPVVSYSPVRGFYDQVVARYHQTGRRSSRPLGGKGRQEPQKRLRPAPQGHRVHLRG